MRYCLGVMVLILVVGCGSKSDSSTSNGSQQKGAASNQSETKAQREARELDEMLVEPSADIRDAMGAEIYPGFRALKFMKGIRSEANGTVLVDYVFFSHDDAEKIRDFYVSKLTGGAKGDPMAEKMGAYIASGKNSKGEDVKVQAHTLGGNTSVHYVVTLK